MNVAMPGIPVHNTMVFWIVRFSAIGPPLVLFSRSIGFFIMESVRRTLDTAPFPEKPTRANN